MITPAQRKPYGEPVKIWARLGFIGLVIIGIAAELLLFLGDITEALL